MCIGGGYTEPPLAVASIPVDRGESQVDIQSPPSIHTSKRTQCISTESYWTRYISVSSLPPTSKELHYLRGGYYTDRVPPLNKGEDGHRDRVSTDPQNQLLYTPPLPYTHLQRGTNLQKIRIMLDTTNQSNYNSSTLLTHLPNIRN